MGTFSQRIRVGAAGHPHGVEVDAIVDTGALYSWVPAPLLRSAGVAPRFRQAFILADGRTIERDCAEATVWINGDWRTTIVVFGDEGSLPLLGAYTLEAFTLTADPANKRLVRMPVVPAVRA